MHLEFDNWLATACPHKDMELVYEHLCNNGAMAKLKRICREIEEGEKFSILSEFLPNFHGGILPA